jgi:hypothetical protein
MRERIKVYIGLIALPAIFAALALCGCEQAPEEILPTKVSTIKGKVVGEDGKPIPGVKVSISGIPAAVAETKADGSFRLTNLTEGTWKLTFEKEGYTSASVTVSVGEGELKDAGTITLARAVGIISGKVSIEGETKHGGVSVSIKELPGVGPAVTKDDGSFLISDVPPGKYTLLAERSGLVSAEVPGVEVKAGATTEVPQIVLKKAMPKEVVVYYSFDKIVGNKVPDESGRGYDGVINVGLTLEPGKRGMAARFANKAFIDLTGIVKPEDIPKEEITICAWINLTNTGGDHEIFNARGSDGTWIFHPEPKGAGYYRWLVRTAGKKTIFEIKAGTVQWDTWVHFAGVYSSKKGYGALYINGEEVDRKDGGLTAPIMGDWDMGARVGLTIDNARPFTGLMDDFIIWNKALTQDEIKKVMVSGPTF